MQNKDEVSPNWAQQLGEVLKQQEALLLGGDVCFSCMEVKPVAGVGMLPNIILRGKVDGKEVPPHKCVAFLLCKECKTNPQSALQVKQNIERMMAEFNSELL